LLGSQDENQDLELCAKFQAYSARYDVETGLLGFRAFQEATTGLLEFASTSQDQVALIWIDLLNLRREFTLAGWSGAEAMVGRVTKILREIAGPQAVVGRFNGRSFLLATLVSDCVEDGRRFAQLVADELMPPGRSVTPCAPEIAVGVAFSPADTLSAEELLRFGCLAASYAIQTRSSTVVAFQPNMNNLLIRDHEMEFELSKALEQCQLRVAYQPKIDLASGQLLGAEALIRWNHEKWGYIPPGDFIPIAERSGLIHRLFECVLRTALQDTRGWMSMGFNIPVIGVNASVANLRQKDFPFVVKRLLEELPIAPCELEIEVTESLLFEEEELFIERLHMLKQIGVRIAIDDFGTRYTGFDVLSRLPIDAMKIDKCFVRGIDRSPDMRALCLTVIAMARQLKMHTVAEGIEEVGELDVMQQIGCDAGQGFLFQKALPVDEFSAFMRTWPVFSSGFGFAGEDDLEVLGCALDATDSEMEEVEPLIESS
jgi:EAL domain-containing protein (putative c-di-GMP-specific phosphodiesterase class I)/GGDEF domain-containing protein